MVYIGPAYEVLQKQTQTLDAPPETPFTPWCRHCKCDVTYVKWQQETVGWRFECGCHGNYMGGALPQRYFGNGFRLEVFCEDDPHMEVLPVWWVTKTGVELQASRAEMQLYQDSAGFMRWLAGHSGPIDMTIGVMAAVGLVMAANPTIGLAFGKVALYAYLAFFAVRCFTPRKK